MARVVFLAAPRARHSDSGAVSPVGSVLLNQPGMLETFIVDDWDGDSGE